MNAFCNMVTIITLNFLTGFLLMNNLWIPTNSYLNKMRLLIWFCLGNMAFKETYIDISTWGTQKRL